MKQKGKRHIKSIKELEVLYDTDFPLSDEDKLYAYAKCLVSIKQMTIAGLVIRLCLIPIHIGALRVYHRVRSFLRGLLLFLLP